MKTLKALGCLILCCGAMSSQAPVVVAVVRPGFPGNTAVGSTWTELQNNWSSYGTRPVVFDQTTFTFGAITSAALAAVNPDVLFFSSSGLSIGITPANQADVEQFLQQPNKRAIGTHHLFSVFLNNLNWLRPIFGIEETQAFGMQSAWDRNIYNLAPQSRLTAGLGSSYLTSAHLGGAVPLDGTYDPGDTLGTIVASGSDQSAVVHYYDGRAGADAICFSYMPEYWGNQNDRQLLYNAITIPRLRQAVLALQGAPSIGTSLGISFESLEQPNAPYALALALGTTTGINMGQGITLPLNPDALFWLSLTPGQPGFVHMSGFLDGSGMAPAWAIFLIPNQPSIIGATVFAAGLTLDAAAPAGIGSLSLPLPITFQ